MFQAVRHHSLASMRALLEVASLVRSGGSSRMARKEQMSLMIARRTPMETSTAAGRSRARPFTENEAELIEYDRTHGETAQPHERDVVFFLLGASSALTTFLFAWVAFKKVWFGWLAMPGWW